MKKKDKTPAGNQNKYAPNQNKVRKAGISFELEALKLLENYAWARTLLCYILKHSKLGPRHPSSLRIQPERTFLRTSNFPFLEAVHSRSTFGLSFS